MGEEREVVAVDELEVDTTGSGVFSAAPTPMDAADRNMGLLMG
ncbi:MAG: hypothetical protein R3C53_07660 [Pirellulaceae bacterium]